MTREQAMGFALLFGDGAYAVPNTKPSVGDDDTTIQVQTDEWGVWDGENERHLVEVHEAISELADMFDVVEDP